MKKIFKSLSNVFKYKRNWFVFVLSFVVIFSSAFTINSHYSDVKKYETISSLFPDNLLIDDSCNYSMKKNLIETYYQGCSYFEVINLTKRAKEFTNLDCEEELKITFMGVDNNFFKCPIIRDGSICNFNRLIFSGDLSYTEEMFKQKGMFVVLPEKLIDDKETNLLKICGRNANVIGTYKTTFENNEVMILFPITTFLDAFSSCAESMMVSLYVDRETYKNPSNYALSRTINKDSLIFATNAMIKTANNTLPTFISLCFIASVSICVLCVFAIKNRYNEIGIKLALGARKIDVLLELVTENMAVVLISSLVAFVLSLVCSTTFESIKTISTGINSIAIHFPVLLFCLSAYLLSSLVFVFIPSLIGVNLNIEGMLKEER